MAPNSESLSRLAIEVGGVLNGADIEVTDVTHDSRSAGPGVLFVAIRGARFDGHDLVPAVMSSGSSAVVVDHRLDIGISQIVVGDTRAALGVLAASVHGHPSDDLKLVGVTGTNGKTTVTHMIEALCAALGVVPGLIGTIQTRVGGEVVPAVRTTPEASDFQRLLRYMVDGGVSVVAAEVSSHALALGRVNGSHFATAAFTNLSQDHLDFHHTMAGYFEAKRLLFSPHLSDRAVVNIDDATGRELAGSCEIPVVTVGKDADFEAETITSDMTGTRFRLLSAGRPIGTGRVPIAGAFNLANALVALACVDVIGLDLGDALAALSSMPSVPGRFEVVYERGPVVVVDYAHSPDGIKKVVESVRAVTNRPLTVVFGAGGDRDRLKRPAMGAAAVRADRVIVTSDNPRSESPAAIIASVMMGIPNSGGAEIQPDRRMAIRTALATSRPEDVILVLGRGHEKFQEIAGEMVPFDDRSVVLEELRALGMVES